MNRLTANIEQGLPYIDHAIQVTDQEAVSMSRYLMQEDGLFIGSSSAINCAAILKLSKQMGPGHTIVTLLCDHGSRHLTKFWNASYLEQKGIVDTSDLTCS